MGDDVSSGRYLSRLIAGGVFCLLAAGVLATVFYNDFALAPPDDFRSELIDLRPVREGVITEPVTEAASVVIISWQTTNSVRP